MQQEDGVDVGERSAPRRAHTDRHRRPRTTPAPVACPYKGLAPFEVADAAFFCGRDRLVDELVARLAVARFVAVIGPSGSGKSSLVPRRPRTPRSPGRAAGSREWRTLTVSPATRFHDTGGRARDARRRPARRAAERGGARRARADHLPGHPRPYGDAIRGPGDGRRRVHRGDFLDRFAAFPAFVIVSESQLLVGPIDDTEVVHAAIEEPARRAGLTLQAWPTPSQRQSPASRAGFRSCRAAPAEVGAPPRRSARTPATTRRAASRQQWLARRGHLRAVHARRAARVRPAAAPFTEPPAPSRAPIWAPIRAAVATTCAGTVPRRSAAAGEAGETPPCSTRWSPAPRHRGATAPPSRPRTKRCESAAATRLAGGGHNSRRTRRRVTAAAVEWDTSGTIRPSIPAARSRRHARLVRRASR